MQRSQILQSRKSESGFTLVELSIVLVIIGLIVSSVLVGQDLVKSATIRNVIAQRDSFDGAANTFRGKYNALPGDGNTVAYNSSLLCSGNSDGLLSVGSTATGAATNSTANNTTANVPATSIADSACFWSVLSQNGAGYIAGSFTGLQGSSANIASMEPVSKYGSSYWGVYSNTGTSSNFYILGSVYSATFIQGASAAIDFTSAIGIDTKVDDGLANGGSVQGFATLATSPDGNVTNGGLTYTAGTLYAIRFKMQSM